MTWSRATYVTELERYLHAENSNRWGAEQKKRMLGLAHLQEWKRLLEKNKGLRSVVRTNQARSATGAIVLSTLSTGLGTNAEQRLYKVQAVGVGGRPIDEMPPGLTPFHAQTTVTAPCWWVEDESLMVMPPGTSAVDVRVQHTPCRLDELDDDADGVTWPFGHEMLLVFTAAQLLLPKGGAETDFARETRMYAEEHRRLLGQEMGRRGALPITWDYADAASDWSPNG